MSNSPNIIFNCGFCAPEISSDENAFYRCQSSNFNIIEYMDRKGASDKLSEEDIAKIKAFVEDTSVTGKSIIGYAKDRHGSTGIFSKDKNEKTEDLAKKLKETGSIIWHSVISFTPEIGNKFCTNKQDAEKLIRENFPTFFKNSALNYDNINWFAAYHTNTENKHIHLVFWEEKPTFIDSKGNKNFRKKGVLPIKQFDDFKAKIAHYFTKHELDFFSVRDELRQGVVNTLQNDKNTFSELLRQSASIIADGHFQYGRLKPTQKKVIDQFAKLIVQNTPQLAKKYKSYKQNLVDLQAVYIKLYTDNNIKNIPQNVKTFYSSREQELQSRLGNALLKQLKSYASKKSALETSMGYENGSWSTDSKLSPKNRKSIVSRELKAFASSLMRFFVAEAAPIIEGHLQSDEAFRQKLKAEGKETIYE